MTSKERSVRDKILRSALNRRRKGFTRVDVMRDSGASARYIHEVINELVADGKLENYKTEGGVKSFCQPRPKPRQRKSTNVEAPQWIMLLLKRKEVVGTWTAVAEELGLSKATISSVVNGEYGASTDNIESLVIAKYQDAEIECPMLGVINRGQCMENKSVAEQAGIRGPRHIRQLRRNCLECML